MKTPAAYSESTLQWAVTVNKINPQRLADWLAV